MPKFEIRRSDGRIQGPFSGTEIRAMAESGRIAPTDELRSQGSEKWVPASKVRGVREHLSPGTLDFSGFDAGGTPSPDPQSFGAPDWSDPEPSPAFASEPAEAPPPPPAPPAGGAPPTDGGSPPTPPPVSGEGGYVPQYGVLRSWARWFERFGWRVVRLSMALAAGSVVGGVVLLVMDGSRNSIAVAPIAAFATLIGCWFPLAATVRWMKSRAALDQPFLLPIALVVLVPLVLAGSTIWFNYFASMAFAGAAGYGLVLAATGFGMVIIGEWLFAHADIASNSWRRQPLPTSIHR